MIYTDLLELKSDLEIDLDDTSEDKQLTWLIQQASNWIEEFCNRQFSYAVRTRVYPGSGTDKLVLAHRPVFVSEAPSWASSLPFQAITVVVDEYAYFGQAVGAFTGGVSSPLTLGVDYCINPDQDDGSSREAILYRINDVWPKRPYRNANMLTPGLKKDLGSVQVISTAGYSPDSLPPIIRWACLTLIEKMRYIKPLGMEIHSDSYAGKGLGFSPAQHDYLMSIVTPRLMPYRNFVFGGGN